MKHRTLAALSAAALFALPALFASPAGAQKDLRDTVTLKNGKEVRGRVLTPHAKDELTVMVGGRRERVRREHIKEMDTVAQRLAELMARREKHKGNPKLLVFVAEWAKSKGMPEMGRLVAMEVALDHPNFDAAHEFLGNRKKRDQWLWRHKKRFVTRDQWEEAISSGSWSKALELQSEHFSLTVDGGVREAVLALCDLENLYLWWHSTHGKDLQLQEALGDKWPIQCRRNDKKFPKWGMRPMPYYTPDPGGDVAFTFYPALNPQRPSKLFFLGTQHILYDCLMEDPQIPDPRKRICDWLEIGLGQYAENAMKGPAGYAKGGNQARINEVDLMNAAAWREDIENLIHMPTYASFYMREDYITQANWGAASSLTAFFMDHKDKDVQKNFRAYIREALGQRKGDSSKVFDKAMKRRIEDFEQDWRQWNGKMAGLRR